MHHIPLYGRLAWSSTYTWCTQKSRAADKRQRVSDMPINIWMWNEYSKSMGEIYETPVVADLLVLFQNFVYKILLNM